MDERIIFCFTYRKSIRTIHFQYGYAGKNDFAGKKYILKITSGEINGKGTSEGNTEEVVFEGEQELLKGVYERKKESLDTKRWEITEKQSATQPSFIRNELIDGEITNDVWWEN